jgi:hypothetical protein
MGQITINTINGAPPYSIYVCSNFLLNCTLVLSEVTSLPFSFDTPSIFSNSPSIAVKIIDSQSCEYIQYYSCLSQTPTPSYTITPTYTPSNNPTQPVTPSNTQTPYTPTPTSTVTPTPTITTTPYPTPSILYGSTFAYLFIEPLSAATEIGNYMQSQGLSFFGFSNGVAPSTNQVDFENEMNAYLNYSGWSSGELISFELQYPNVPYPSGNDFYGNPMLPYNFMTTVIPTSSNTGPSWYTFFITSTYTDGLYQKSIDIGIGAPNIFSQVNNNSTYYNIDFTSKIGNRYIQSTRMYTSFPSIEFLLDNTQNLYFKGSVIGA